MQTREPQKRTRQAETQAKKGQPGPAARLPSADQPFPLQPCPHPTLPNPLDAAGRLNSRERDEPVDRKAASERGAGARTLASGVRGRVAALGFSIPLAPFLATVEDEGAS